MEMSRAGALQDSSREDFLGLSQWDIEIGVKWLELSHVTNLGIGYNEEKKTNHSIPYICDSDYCVAGRAIDRVRARGTGTSFIETVLWI